MARKPSSKAAQSATMSEAASLLKAQGLDVLTPNVRPPVIIPFGISGLDHDILGTGGLVAGKITQFWGPHKSGKSTLALRAIAQAQRLFPTKFAVLLDSEFSFDRQRAIDAGVDLDRLQLIQDNIAEVVYDKVLRYVASGACSIVVLDTLANLIARDKSANLTNNQEGGKSTPGQFARITKPFAQDLCRYIHEFQVVLIICNQQTMKIAVMYGDPTDYPGGEAFRHNLQVSLRLRQIGFVTDDDPQKTPVGVKVAVNVDKNKLALERKSDDSNHPIFYFKNGIDRSKTESLFDDAIRKGFLIAGGSGNFRLVDLEGQEIKKWRGIANVKKELAENSDLANRIAELVYRSGGALPPTTFDESEMSEVSE